VTLVEVRVHPGVGSTHPEFLETLGATGAIHEVGAAETPEGMSARLVVVGILLANRAMESCSN